MRFGKLFDKMRKTQDKPESEPPLVGRLKLEFVKIKLNFNSK